MKRCLFAVIILIVFFLFTSKIVKAERIIQIPLFSENNSPIALFYPIKLLKNGYLSSFSTSLNKGIWIVVKLPDVAYPGTSSESDTVSNTIGTNATPNAIKKIKEKLVLRISEYYYTKKDSIKVYCYLDNGTNITLTELKPGTEYKVSGIKVGENDNKIISPTLWIRFDAPRILKHFLKNSTLKCIIKYTNVYAKVENGKIKTYNETQEVHLELSFTDQSSDYGINHLGSEYCNILLNVSEWSYCDSFAGVCEDTETARYLETYCVALLPLLTFKIINNASQFDTVIVAYRVFNLSSNTTKLAKLVPAVDTFVIRSENKIIIIDYESNNLTNLYLGTILITKCKNGKVRMALVPPVIEKEKDITEYTCLYGEGVDNKLKEILSNYKLWIENNIRQTFFYSYPIDAIYYSSIVPASSDGKIKMLITAVTTDLPKKLYLTPAIKLVYFTNSGPINTTVVLSGNLSTISSIIPDASEVISEYKKANSELKNIKINIPETNETIRADLSFKFPTYKVNINPWIEINVGNYKFILQVIAYGFSSGVTPYELSVLTYTNLSANNRIDEGYFVTYKPPLPRVSVPTYETVIYKRPALGEYKTGEFDNSSAIFIIFSPQPNSTQISSTIPLLLDISPLRRVYFDVILNKKLGSTPNVNASQIKADLIIGALIYKYGLSSELGILLESDQLLESYTKWIITGRLLYQQLLKLYDKLKPGIRISWYEVIRRYFENNKYKQVKEKLNELINNIITSEKKLSELFNKFETISMNITNYQPVTTLVTPVILQVQNFASLTNNVSRNIKEYLEVLKDVCTELEELSDFIVFLEVNESELIKKGIPKKKIEELKRKAIETYMILDSLIGGLFANPSLMKIKISDFQSKISSLKIDLENINHVYALRGYRAFRKAIKALIRLDKTLTKIKASVFSNIKTFITTEPTISTTSIYLVLFEPKLLSKIGKFKSLFRSLKEAVVRAYVDFSSAFHMAMSSAEYYRYGATTRVKVGLYVFPVSNNPVKSNIFYQVLSRAAHSEDWKGYLEDLLNKIDDVFYNEINKLDNLLKKGKYKEFREKVEYILKRIASGDTGNIGKWAKEYLKRIEKMDASEFAERYGEAIIEGLHIIEENYENLYKEFTNAIGDTPTPASLEKAWATKEEIKLPFPTDNSKKSVFKPVKVEFGHLIDTEIETNLAEFFDLPAFKYLEEGNIAKSIEELFKLLEDYANYVDGKENEIGKLIDVMRKLNIIDEELASEMYWLGSLYRKTSLGIILQHPYYSVDELTIFEKLLLLKGGKSGGEAIKIAAINQFIRSKTPLNLLPSKTFKQMINDFENLIEEYKSCYYLKGFGTVVEKIRNRIFTEIIENLRAIREEASLARKIGALFGTGALAFSTYGVPAFYILMGISTLWDVYQYNNILSSTIPEKTGYMLTYNIESGLCTLPICPMISPLKQWVLEKVFSVKVWSQKVHFIYFAAPPFDIAGSPLLNPVGIFMWKEEPKILGIPASVWKQITGWLLIAVGIALLTVVIIFTGGAAAASLPWIVDLLSIVIAMGLFIDLPYPPFSDLGFAVTLNVPRIIKEAARSVLDRYEKFKDFIENEWRKAVSHGNENLSRKLSIDYLVQTYLLRTGKIIYVINETSKFFEYACKYLYFGKYENGKCYIMYWLKEAIKDFPALNKSIWPAYPIEIDKKYMFDYYPSYTVVVSSTGSKEFVILLKDLWEGVQHGLLPQEFINTLKEVAKEYNETITEYPHLAFEAPYIPVMYELYKMYERTDNEKYKKELGLLAFYTCYSFLSKYQLYAPMLYNNPMFNYTFRLCKALAKMKGCIEPEEHCMIDEVTLEESCIETCKKEINDVSELFDLYIAKATQNKEPVWVGLGTTPVGSTVDLNNNSRKIMFTSPLSFVINGSSVLLSSTLVIPLGYTNNTLNNTYINYTIKIKDCVFWIYCWDKTKWKLLYHPFYLAPNIKIKAVIIALNNTIGNVPIFKVYKSYNTEIVNVFPSKLNVKYYELVEVENYKELISLLNKFKKEGLKVSKTISILLTPSKKYVLFEGVGLYPATYRLISGFDPITRSFYSTREFFLNDKNFVVISENELNKIKNVKIRKIKEITQDQIFGGLLNRIYNIIRSIRNGVLQIAKEIPPYELDEAFYYFSTTLVNELLKNLTDKITKITEGKLNFNYIEQNYWWRNNTIKFIKERVAIVKGNNTISLLVYKPYISFIDFRPKIKPLNWLTVIDPSHFFAKLGAVITQHVTKMEVVNWDEWATYRTYEKYPAPYSAIFGVTVKVPADKFLRDYERCKTEYGKCMVLLVADVNFSS